MARGWCYARQMIKPALALLLAALFAPGSVSVSPKRPAEARAGFIANRMHPGDPYPEIGVAGFHDWAAAAAFAAGDAGSGEPIFERKLARGEGQSFAEAALPGQAAVLVLYAQDEHGQRTPLQMVRAHADIPLSIGSCGYQLLLGFDRGEPAPAAEPIDRDRHLINE
jgi:hypothetical protein